MAKTTDQKEQEITKVEVIKELPLEKVIDQTLTKNNVTKKVLAALKDKYMTKGQDGVLELKPEYKLKSPTDKETYLTISEERKGVRKVGIITEKLCKEGRADAVKAQKAWLAKENEILDEVALVQNPLDAQIKIFEDEQERLRLEEEDRKDKQLITRQNELIKMGAVNANGCMNINDLSIENSNIREADDEDYQKEILPLFKMHFENNEKERIAKEEQQKKDDELRKQQQQKLQEDNERLQKERDELQKQKDAFAKQQQEMKQQKIKNRCLQLDALGMKFSFRDDAYIFEGVNVDNKTEVSLLDDAEWEVLLQKIKPAIENEKAAIKLKEERQKTRSVQLSGLGMTFTGSAYQFENVNISATDLTSMDDNNWNALITTTEPIIADLKQKAEQKKKDDWQKQQQEEEENKKRLQEEENAKASDKEKWAVFVNALRAVAIPEFKSGVYKGKLATARQRLEEISDL